jgi:hypothetical protein
VNEGCISSDEKMTIDGVVTTVILKSVSMAADDISGVELTVIVGCIMIGKVEAAVTETLNETITFRTTSFMSSQVVSSASVETPLNMSLVMTPSTYFFKS